MTFSNLVRQQYLPGPSRFGRYPMLPASSAMTSYPIPRRVPEHIPRPEYVPRNFFSAGWGEHEPAKKLPELKHGDLRIGLGGEDEKALRMAGELAGKVLDEVGKLIRPGMTTNEIDRAVHEMVVGMGAYPSTLGYSQFPRSCTTSVNNVIAHGIPDDRPLHPEDIVNVDITLFHQGFHGDTSATFVLPDADKPARELVAATEEALELGIQACGPGKPFQLIGEVIKNFAGRHGFSVNSQLGGHAIGRSFHGPPWIIHTRNTEAGAMQPGDCFTIEPILVQGKDAKGDLWDDGWTMATLTGARAAQAEHQILITHDGADVLTARKNDTRR